MEWLRSVHFYRKVPRDLTDATRLGGVLSLVCAAMMAYLFVSNIAAYMKMTTTTDVALDVTGDVHMRLFFNITMVRAFFLCARRAIRLGICRAGQLAAHRSGPGIAPGARGEGGLGREHSICVRGSPLQT